MFHWVVAGTGFRAGKWLVVKDSLAQPQVRSETLASVICVGVHSDREDADEQAASLNKGYDPELEQLPEDLAALIRLI